MGRINKRDREGGGGKPQYVRGNDIPLKGTNLTVVARRQFFISPAWYCLIFLKSYEKFDGRCMWCAAQFLGVVNNVLYQTYIRVACFSVVLSSMKCL